jgi:hypothetical protein
MLVINKSSLTFLLVGAAVIAGCGSSSSSSTTSAQSASPATTASSGSAAGGSSTAGSGGASSTGAGALSADARSAATGDIPDNQVFLVFTNHSARYSMKYPEGWTLSGKGHSVTFRDKNNLVHVLVGSGASPTPAGVTAQLNALKKNDPTLAFRPPQTVKIGSQAGVKTVYTTESAPNPVTGKRVKLIVNRYELARGGKVATVDLGTPVGVDNVDAYRMMIESFRWR